jgi:hypothetical protein
MNTQTSHTNQIHTLTLFRDSVVGILIMLWAERSGARNPVEEEIVYSPKRPDRLRGPPKLFNRYRDAFTGEKRPWRDAHASPPSRAAIKNVWGLYL